MPKLPSPPKRVFALARLTPKKAADTDMSIPGHCALYMFHFGGAGQTEWDQLCFRIALGVDLGKDYTDPVSCALGDAMVSLHAVYARHRQQGGVWKMHDVEVANCAHALAITDELERRANGTRLLGAYTVLEQEIKYFYASRLDDDLKIYASK